MSENIRRVGRELKYKGAILDVYTDHMEFANGNTAEWDFIKHKGAAAVVPVTEDGKLVVVWCSLFHDGKEAAQKVRKILEPLTVDSPKYKEQTEGD